MESIALISSDPQPLKVGRSVGGDAAAGSGPAATAGTFRAWLVHQEAGLAASDFAIVAHAGTPGTMPPAVADSLPSGRILPPGGQGLPTPPRAVVGGSVTTPDRPETAAARPALPAWLMPSVADAGLATPQARVASGEFASRAGSLDADRSVLSAGLPVSGPTLFTAGPLSSDSAAVLAPLSGRPGHQDWSAELTGRVMLLSRMGVDGQRVQLRLDPPHLGLIEVEILARDSGTQVYLGSGQAGAREALDLALPRLRELFAAEGLALAHAQVGDGQAQGHGSARDPWATTADRDRDWNIKPSWQSDPAPAPHLLRLPNAVDYYA